MTAQANTTVSDWRYEIQHGPEGEANYAWLYDETGKMVGTLQTYQAAKIVAGMNARRATADVTKAMVERAIKAFDAYDPLADGATYHEMMRTALLAALNPPMGS